MNGVTPPPRGPQDMDGETVRVEPSRLRSGNTAQSVDLERPRPSRGTDVADRLQADVSTRVSMQGFLLGPEAAQSVVGARERSGDPASTTQRRSTQSFLSGVAKAVQSFPAAVEGFVMGQGGAGSANHEVEGYASAQSGSPDGVARPPSERQVPNTPLLDEHTLQRLNVLQSTAPHLYQQEPPASTVKPPSTSSSDLQAEVRRQVQEFMAVRDDENRLLRGRVELLMSENQVLRQEIHSQMYSNAQVPRTGTQGGLAGWINRGIGTLIGSSPKPPTPQRALELRPPLPPVAEVSTGNGLGPDRSRRPRVDEIPRPPVNPTNSSQPPRGEVPGVASAGAECLPDFQQQSRAHVDPASRVLDFDSVGVDPPEVPESRPIIPEGRPLDPMDVVLSGMAQLQGVVADLANSPKQQAPPKQEVIKPGVTTLPDLPAAGPEACLLFSDWLHATKPALSDISDTSEELWSIVLAEAGAWYARFLTMDPISRLTSKPIPSETVGQLKWVRVSRRIETMILAACPSAIREEISAARVTGLLQVVARLYVIYAPGGLSEREMGLKQIQEPSPGTNVKDTIEQLRRWNRWCDRITELGGSLPDCALRVKALERITRVVLQSHPDVAFRINLTRAALQVDTNPDDTKVVQLHAQMLGELEAISHRSGSRDTDKAKDHQNAAKVKGVEQAESASPNPKAPKYSKPPAKAPSNPKSHAPSEATSAAGTPCTFFVGPNGCKKGADCAFVHNWNSFSAAEKAQRCRNCGSKGHRANECRAGAKGEEKAKYKSPPIKPKTPAGPKANDGAQAQGVAPPVKDISQQQIKTMLADAAQILQQAVPVTASPTPAVPISSPCPPPQASQQVGSQPPQTAQVTQGVPVTLAALNAQIESLRALAQEHEVKMIEFSAEIGKVDPTLKVGSQALLDSGATHAVIPYEDKLRDLERVAVTLAGDAKEEWFRTAGGTLVVPPAKACDASSSRFQTILPLGALVQSLGCKVSWSRRKGLKVVHPVLGPLKTGVSSNTCPYIQEEQALKLISELESQRLREFEQSVQAMEAELHQVSSPVDPTDSLRKYIRTGKRGDLLRAIFAQPYLKQVPEAIKVRMCEDIPGIDEESGWQLLKRLPLSRSRRRSLHASGQWVIYLGAGSPSEVDPLKTWAHSQGFEYLSVDILQKGGKGWDLASEGGVWSVLLWAAATGRVAAVLSTPPYRSWVSTDASSSSRTVEDPWGAPEIGDTNFKESLLMLQDQVLWALSSVARGRAIPYLKELPASMPSSTGAVPNRMCPERYWETDSWMSFRQWARMHQVRFCQGSLGHSWLRPSVIGTNLDLKHLQDLPKKGRPTAPIPEEVSPWCVGLKKEVVDALEGKVRSPPLEQLDRTISVAISALADKRNQSPGEISQAPVESSSSGESESESSSTDLVNQESDCAVSTLMPAEVESWKNHLLNGHVPYRRDCKQCVEGAGLGMQHRKVKNPQAYTLSVDLFGPMPATEKGRDEQSVSGNPHLRFGLVGVFRLPKSAVIPIQDEKHPSANDEAKDGEGTEYEPSEPGEVLSDEMIELIRNGSDGVEVSEQIPVPLSLEGEPASIVRDEEEPTDSKGFEDQELESVVRDLKSGVELLTLRYFIGLKSKTGADVTAGIQRLILKIKHTYPLTILHCDPGTEFSSDALARWLPSQGVRLQTTVPTDKQSNGLAERTVGWFKSRARTLLASGRLPASYWPIAMRWASEAHNRLVLKQSPLPAFGQPVLHKLKRPPAAQKELLTRWITAVYGAPHLTIPEGHVLITTEGNLVASKGFRKGVVDPQALEEVSMPTLQSEEPEAEGEGDEGLDLSGDKDLEFESLFEEERDVSVPDRRLRDKTTVRFLEGNGVKEDDPEHLAKASLMDDDLSEASFLRVAEALEGLKPQSRDRRGDMTAKFVLGAFSHGGQRGITTMCRTYPAVAQFLNKFLRGRVGLGTPDPKWSTVMLVHASDVAVHRDHRNEWGSYNYVTSVAGPTRLWIGPPRDSKKDSASIKPAWDTPATTVVGKEACVFDPRNYHAVKKHQDWVLVGYTPLGTKKLPEADREFLERVGFPLPATQQDDIQVKVVSSENPEPEPEGSNDSAPADVQGDLLQDLQPDANAMIVGWDLSEGATRNYPAVDLPDTDLHRFLEERGVVHSYQQLVFLGVEEPEDLLYLFMEDLVEFGIPKQDADRIMTGIHPPGTRRPDNPNTSALRTGEVRLLDREQRQIPWVIQNRTLTQRSPGPPLPNLGVRTDPHERTKYKKRWDESPRDVNPQEEQSSSSSTAAWLAPVSGGATSSSDRPAPISVATRGESRSSVPSSCNAWVDNVVPASYGRSWDGDRKSKPSSSTSWSDDGWQDHCPRDRWRWDDGWMQGATKAWAHNQWYEGEWRGSWWAASSQEADWGDSRKSGSSSSQDWRFQGRVNSHPDLSGDRRWWSDAADVPPPETEEQLPLPNSGDWGEPSRPADQEFDPWGSDPWGTSPPDAPPVDPQEVDSGPGHVWEDEWTPTSTPAGWVAPWTTVMPPAAYPSSSSSAHGPQIASDRPEVTPDDAEDDPFSRDPPWVIGKDNPQVKMLRVDSNSESQHIRQRDIRPQSCSVTPRQVCEANTSQACIGVHFPDVVTARPPEGLDSVQTSASSDRMPEVKKVVENSYTPNIEELLANLTGPLEVVHQVSPSEVKRNLEKWVSPAQDEVDSLETMQAIKRHKGPAAKKLLADPNVELLPAKGVFTVKPGKPFRRKVRIVSCGNFAKTIAEEVLYASGAAAETLRTVLVYAGKQRRSAWATDIKNAFLLAPIPKTATKRYALKPPVILIALGICDPSEIWEVCRALYGFKEAPKWWSQYRDEVLSTAEVITSLGKARLKRAVSDENLWKLVLDDDTCIAHVLVYVDDLLILACRSVATALFEWIRSQWQCSELEQAQVHKPLRFLGVDVFEIRDDHSVCGFALAQEGYIDELVRSHNLGSCARAVVPVPKEWVKSAPPEEGDYGEGVLREAQKITGELLWLSQRTRIDVCFAVGLMSSWAVRSPAFVCKLGLRILAYLANTKDFRLNLRPEGGKDLEVFTDASFAPFSDRSISGIVVQMMGRCVFWKSRRQTLVSLSTAESELIAACEGVVLGQSVEALITELLNRDIQKELRVDNVAAITLAEGGGSQRTRHLRVRANFLKEMTEKGSLRVIHCPGEVQLADCLTKALPAPRISRLNAMLGVGVVEQADPTVQAVLATNRTFQAVDSSEGQSMLLILALMMAQMTPAASQAEDDEPNEVGLDLWIIGSLMAFSLLFIWELGKHCLRECIRSRSSPSICSIQLSDEEQRQRRERRQDAVRRAIEREAGTDLRRRHTDSPEEVPLPSFSERSTRRASHVHVHLNSSPPRHEEMTPYPSESPRAVDLRHWNRTSALPSTSAIPPPPPPPVPVEEVRKGPGSRQSRTVSTQTDGPRGLTD